MFTAKLRTITCWSQFSQVWEKSRVHVNKAQTSEDSKRKMLLSFLLQPHRSKRKMLISFLLNLTVHVGLWSSSFCKHWCSHPSKTVTAITQLLHLRLRGGTTTAAQNAEVGFLSLFFVGDSLRMWDLEVGVLLRPYRKELKVPTENNN